MKRIFKAYKDLISILLSESPWIVILTFLATIIDGILVPISIYVNQNVFDGGLAVARGQPPMEDYIVFPALPCSWPRPFSRRFFPASSSSTWSPAPN